MHKQSPLQKNLISIIDNSGGINELLKSLQSYKRHLNSNDKLMFSNFINFYQSLYLSYHHAETDFINYRDLVIEHRNLLERCISIKSNDKLILLHSVVTYGMDYTHKLRLLG